MKASARKSHGEFKPVIIHPNGRNETVGRNTRYCPYTHREFSRRGVTFEKRPDAVAYAAQVINRRLDFKWQRDMDRIERHARYAEQQS